MFLLGVVFLQAEISLCRVYKRTGVEDHPSLPRTLQTTARNTPRPLNYDNKLKSENSSTFTSFEGQSTHHTDHDKISETKATDIIGTALGLSSHTNSPYNNIITATSSTIFPNSIDDLHRIISSQQALENCPPSQLLNMHNYQFNVSSSYSPHLMSNNMLSQPQPQPQLELTQLHSQALLAPNYSPAEVPGTFPTRLWGWNSTLSDGSKDFTDPFK